jgi:hypothetical protein
MLTGPASRLLADHSTLEWFIAHVRSSHGEAAASLLEPGFAEAIEAHIAMVDAELMATIRQGADPHAAVYRDSHWYLKRSLVQLRAMDHHSALFARWVQAVCDRLEQQLVWEEKPLAGDMPQAANPLSSAPPVGSTSTVRSPA